MFGGPAPQPGEHDPTADLALSITTSALSAHDPEVSTASFGWLHISGVNALPFDGAEFGFSTSDAGGHFVQLDEQDGWSCLAFRGSELALDDDGDDPMYAFRDRDCLFRLVPEWRKAVVLLILYRLLRLRADAIFFHAAAVGIGGAGSIFIGPKGAGKSTTALALAARGHALLSDEFAGYVPTTGELVPFLRPVGIKPGIRARRIEEALTPELHRRIERDGFARVSIETLVPVSAPATLPLRRVIFLAPFEDAPRLERIEPTRHDVAMLQPILSSFLNASHRQRIFELVRMLASTRVYRLHPGLPDATADHLQEVFENE